MKKINICFILIYFFSIISIAYTLFSIRSIYEYNYYNSKISKASLSLSQLKRDSNEIYAIQKELNKFYTLLSEKKFDTKELEKQYYDFNQTGYNFIKLRFFDKKNNVINLNNYNNNDSINGAMQRLYYALASYKQNNNNNSLKRYRSLFETLLGAVDLNQLAKDSSTLVPVTLSGKPGYIYWNIYDNDSENQELGGLIAWIKKSDIPNKLLVQRQVEKFNLMSFAEEDKRIFGFTDANINGNIYPEKILDSIDGITYNDLFIKIQEMKASLKNHDYLEKYLINYVEFSKEKYFFCLTSISNNHISWALAISSVVILVISAIFIGLYYYRIIQKIEKDAELQLLNKKLIITASICGLILIVFSFSVNVFIYNLSIKNKNESIYSNLTSALDWLDESYSLAKNDLSEKLLVLSQNEDVKNLDISSINSIVESYAKKHLISRMYITNKDGNIMFSFPESKDSIFNKIIPIIGRKVALERLGSEENWKNKIDNMMINTVSLSFTDLLGEGATNLLNAFEKADTVSELELGNKRHLVFTTIVESKKEQPLIIIIWLDSDYFSYDYLINKIKDSQSLPENLRKITLAMVPVHLDSSPYPLEIAKYSFSRDITERVNFTKRSIQFESVMSGQKCYGVGTKLNAIPNYVIFALQEE